MRNDSPLNVALIGYGNMSRTHLGAWRLNSNSRIKGVWGRNAAKVRTFAKTNGVKPYPTLQSILDDESIDIVDVCTPSDTHAKFSIESLTAGKHVLVEKPLALTLAEADQMIEASERHSVKLMVAHVLRFFPEYDRVMQLIKAGKIGRPIIARAFRGTSLPPLKWLWDIKRSGGVVFDLAIHDIDFLLACYGERVVRVYAKVAKLVHRRISAHDFLIATLKFEGHGIAFVNGSFALPKASPFMTKLNIDGTRGTIQLDNQNSAPVKLTSDNGIESFYPQTLRWQSYLHSMPLDPFLAEIKHFTECIRLNHQPITNGEVARTRLEVCTACLMSSKRNAPVNLPLEG
jgi:predicted dehydrogenase